MVVIKNDYLTMPEMQENALFLFQSLKALGWSIYAISGMLGNMQTESNINPGLWQNRDEGNPNLGVGLVQWTPSTKLTDWATQQGKAYDTFELQIERIEYEVANGIQWIATSEYDLSFADFKTSTQSPEWLAQAFLKNYERPSEQNQPERSTQARYWYNYLIDYDSEYEVAQFPMDMIHITQGEDGSYSHKGTLSIDFVGTHAEYPYYAPCEVECVRVIPSSAVVIWRTVNEVLCADGSIRKFTFSCIHETPLWQTEGMILQKGELMGHTGIGGNVTGDHLHLQVIDGNQYNGFTVNSEGSNTLVGTELHIYDVFSTGGVDIVEGYGYDWKVIEGDGGDGGDDSTKPTDLMILYLTKAFYTGGW